MEDGGSRIEDRQLKTQRERLSGAIPEIQEVEHKSRQQGGTKGREYNLWRTVLKNLSGSPSISAPCALSILSRGRGRSSKKESRSTHGWFSFGKHGRT